MTRFFLLFFALLSLANADGMDRRQVLAYVDELGFPKSYYQIRDREERARAFVDHLLPIIVDENRKIAEEMAFVDAFFSRHSLEWSGEELLRLSKLAKKYRIRNLYDEKTYRLKIGLVPESLALGQAALESAWGKSRFVKEANNIFGQWTFGKTGIAPKEREEGKTHKLKVFRNLNESVAAYMLNLNRNAAYREFRKKRLELARAGERMDGLAASETMHRYSEIGDEYVQRLKKVIRANAFDRHDGVTPSSPELRYAYSSI